MALKKTSNKIPLEEFCKRENKKVKQVYKLVENNPQLKAKVYGERTMRINMDEWEKLLENA